MKTEDIKLDSHRTCVVAVNERLMEFYSDKTITWSNTGSDKKFGPVGVGTIIYLGKVNTISSMYTADLSFRQLVYSCTLLQTASI